MSMRSSCKVRAPAYLGLKMFGKNWKKIESVVKSRTGSQIRSHAQKFFNKLEKKIEGGLRDHLQGDSEAREPIEGTQFLWAFAVMSLRSPLFLPLIINPANLDDQHSSHETDPNTELTKVPSKPCHSMTAEEHNSPCQSNFPPSLTF